MGAIVVGITLDSLAMNLRIAVVTRTTTTGRPMILAVAFCVDGAFVVQDARVHALSVVTGGCVVALAVRFAIELETS